jgi:ABC-type bacteriocin/lantibiotic exporter with double-glycine peptidase domain
MFTQLQNLWQCFDRTRKNRFFFLVGLMVIASLVEIFSISAVIPFIVTLTSPSKVFHNQYLEGIFLSLGYTQPDQIMLPMTLVFIVISAFAAVVRLSLLWLNNKYIFEVGKELGYRLYCKILYQDYEIQIQRNSSEVINTLSNKINNVVYSSIMTSMNFISSTIMSTFILLGLLLIDYKITIAFIAFFGLIYLVIIKLTRGYLYRNGVLVSQSSSRLIMIIQEGLGGIRDIIIDQSQATFCNDYRANDSNLRASQLKNIFISNSPRFFIEGMGMIGIALAAYYLTIHDGPNSSIAMLAILAVGAQKLIPLVQQAYTTLTEFKATQHSLQDILDLLNAPESRATNVLIGESSKLNFNDSIKLEDIVFSYAGSSHSVLNKLNLTIHKGDRVGIIGETGSGKSTFLDILMGLLNVQQGKFLVDERSVAKQEIPLWRKHIAHVPQSIYLADSSIAENIAFGRTLDEIDMDLIQKVAREAKLDEVIKRLPSQYQTNVGERGVMLSGGQRQRIGIARALYKRADVIVLDEATSALDEQTEASLMENIYELDPNLTLIIVAHRLTTLKGCNRILRVNNGVLHEVDPKTIFG